MIERALGITSYQVEQGTALLISLIILPVAGLAGLYPGLGQGSVVEFRQLARSLIATLLVYAGIGWFCFPVEWVFYSISAAVTFVVALPGLMTMRFIARQVAKHLPFWGVPTLILADPRQGVEIFRRLQRNVDQGFRPVGILLNQESYWDNPAVPEDIPVFDVQHADEAAVRSGSTWVFVSPCSKRKVAPSLDPSLAAIPNRILLSSNELDLGIWDHPIRVGDTSGLRFGGSRGNFMELAAKRCVDFLLTSVACLLGAPFLLFLCVSVRMSSRGPIFYGQKRVGRGGREFTAWKFRSMMVNADAVLEEYLDSNPAARAEWEHHRKLENDPRVTRIGRFLRKTSLDELPQLWNVLRGEMSLVGPRPIVNSGTYDLDYIERFPNEFEVYKSVRPGLTGLWQVRCRNSGVYEMRIFWDMYYIRNWSIWLDLYLIMRTIKTVLFREGAA